MCGTVSLEGAKEFVVLYRVAAGQVEKIRTYATDCTFDAGDLPLYWLTGVDGVAERAAALDLHSAGGCRMTSAAWNGSLPTARFPPSRGIRTGLRR